MRSGGAGTGLEGHHGRAGAFHHHHLHEVFGKDAGVAQGDHAAERVRHDPQRGKLLLMDQLREVVHVLAHAIARTRRPLRVAVAAQIDGDDVVVGPQALRDPVPVVCVVAVAVDEQQRRRFGVAPVEVVQAQALREVGVRRGTCRPRRELTLPVNHAGAA